MVPSTRRASVRCSNCRAVQSIHLLWNCFMPVEISTHNSYTKIQHPTQPADFRPISITPVLSRVLERLVVRAYIYPSLLTPPSGHCFTDQFAFRPTGSTTAALITLVHTVLNMLSAGPFVRVFALDFSKAFDMVRHYSTLPTPAPASWS